MVGMAALAGCGHQAVPGADPAGVPPAARQLAAELAVLRRPQTGADRSLPAGVLHGEIVPGLTRLVATARAGTEDDVRVFLVVFGLGPCSRFTGHLSPTSPKGGDRVALVTLPSNGIAGHRGTWSFGMSFSAAELKRFAVVPTGFGVASSVVPDGVSRVKWVFHRYRPGKKPAQLVTVYPEVRNNVAATPVGLYEVQPSATWQLANGQILTSADESANLPECRSPMVVPGATHPVAAWLKQYFAVFRTPRLTRPMAIDPLEFREAFTWQRLGLNFAQARFVATGTGLLGAKPGVWVVPGSRGVCLLDAVGNGMCAPRAGYPDRLYGSVQWPAPESGGFRVSSRDLHGKNMYSGLVPDGNRTVSVVLADGTVKTVRVVDNVYSITVRGRAIAVIDVDAAGHPRRFPLFVNDNQF